MRPCCPKWVGMVENPQHNTRECTVVADSEDFAEPPFVLRRTE